MPTECHACNAIIISTTDISAINSYQGRWNLQTRNELSLQDFDFHWSSLLDPTAMFTLAQADKTTSNTVRKAQM
jgi:hypothetical protein